MGQIVDVSVSAQVILRGHSLCEDAYAKKLTKSLLLPLTKHMRNATRGLISYLEALQIQPLFRVPLRANPKTVAWAPGP